MSESFGYDVVMNMIGSWIQYRPMKKYTGQGEVWSEQFGVLLI